MFIRVRNHIRLITGIVLMGLALNTALDYPSAVVDHYEQLGISHAWQAGVLLAGGILILRAKTPPEFIVGTIPYAWYVISTVYIALDQGGGYPAALIYVFSYLQLLALYDCKNGVPDG